MYQSSNIPVPIGELISWLDKLPSLSFVEVPGGQIFLNRKARQVLQWPEEVVKLEEWASWMHDDDFQHRQTCQHLLRKNSNGATTNNEHLVYELHLPSNQQLKIREEISQEPLDGKTVFISTAYVLETSGAKHLPDATRMIDSMQQGVEYLKAYRDEEGKIIDFVYCSVNPYAFRMIDKKRELGQKIINCRMLEVFPNFPRENFQKYVEVVESDISLEEEFLYPLNSAQGKWYIQHVNKVNDGIAIVYWSIDKQKVYEQKLVDNNRMVDSLLDSTTVGMDVIRPMRDEGGHIYDFYYEKSNQQALKTHGGYGFTSTEGKTVLEIYPSLKDSEIFDILLNVLQSGNSHLDEMHFLHQDQEKWFYYNYVKFGDGILISHLDISESKNAREQLRQNAEFIEGIFNTSSAAIEALEAVRDEQGNIVDFVFKRCNKKSREVQRIVGKQHKEGKSLLELYPNIQANGLFQRLIKVVESGQSIQMEVPYQMGEGGNIQWFLSEYSSFGDEGLILTYVDISQQKKAEVKLKDALHKVNVNHTNLTRMIDSTNDLICSIDTKMRFIGFNKACQEEFFEMFGVKIRQGMDLKEVTHSRPELSERLLSIWNEAFSGNMFHEIKNFGADNQSDFRIDFHKIYGPDKELIGLTSISTNLSQQRKIEKALKDASEFVLLSENLPNIVFILNTEGHPEYFNDAFYEFTGLAKADFTLDDLFEYIFVDDQLHLTKIVGEHIYGHKPQNIEYRFRLRHHSGQFRWVLLKLVPILDKQKVLTNWLGSMTDIHEEIINEAVQRNAAEEFRQIANGLPQLVWVTQADGNATYFNDPWYLYTGTKYSDNLGWGWLGRLHPEDVEHCKKEWEKSLGRGNQYQVEFRLRSSTGRYRWFLFKGIPLKNQQGNIEKWFGTCTDIENQRKQQQQLLKQNDKLNQINEYLENFVNALAHNLRAPVANIQGLLNLLKETDNENLREKVVEKLQISNDLLDNTVIGMVKLIEAQHRTDHEISQVDIMKCFQHVKHNLNGTFDNIDFRLDFQLKVRQVRFVEGLFAIAFNNLLTNAVKFRKTNQPLEVKVESWQEKNYSVVSFSDNGQGIDLDVHGKNLFKPFFRLNRKSEGQGLGLHFVYHLFRREGGKVEVNSEPGEGAEFKLFVPRQ